MFQKLFLGPVTHEENQKLKDVSVREILILAPILLMAFWIGLYPKPFFMLMAPAVEKLTTLVQSAALLAH
jgi:NADH-quinone oxidoreductase subunit M